MAATKMDRDELNTTAAMARLSLGPEEAERLEAAVLQMLDYFSKMLEVDVAGLEPTTHVLLSENRLRADHPDAFGEPERLLENAPELEERFITIPNVL